MALVWEFARRDPMRMTWFVFDDHIRRIVPFLQKIKMGKALEAADIDAVDAPLKFKPYKA